MIKLTVKEAYAIHEAMSIHIQSGKTIKGKVGLAFAYNFRLIHDSMGEYIARRNEIISKYADPIDSDTHENNLKNGVADPIVVSDPEKLRLANNEIREFENLSIELPLIEITNEDIINTPDIDSSDASILIWMSTDYIEASKNIKK